MSQYSMDHKFSQVVSECFRDIGEHQFVNPIDSYPWGGRNRIIGRIRVFEKYLKPEDVLHARWLQNQAMQSNPNDWRSREVGIEYVNRLMQERSGGTFEQEMDDIANAQPSVMEYAKQEYGPSPELVAQWKRERAQQRREGMQLVGSSGLLPDPALRIDNPGGRWLESKRREIAEDGLTRLGAPAYVGPVTGSFDRHVMLPVKVLADVPGLRREQDLVREQDLRSLLEYCRVNGRFPPSATGGPEDTYNPFVQVTTDGKPWMNEGNHRVMVADILGWEYVPVLVRYFAGGEGVDGALSPMRVREYDRAARAGGHTLTNYGGKRVGADHVPVELTDEIEAQVLARMPRYAVLEIKDTLTAAFTDMGRRSALETLFFDAAKKALEGYGEFDLEDANGNVVGSFSYRKDPSDLPPLVDGDGAIRMVLDLETNVRVSERRELAAEAIAVAQELAGAAMIHDDVQVSFAHSAGIVKVSSSGYGPIAHAEVALRQLHLPVLDVKDLMRLNRDRAERGEKRAEPSSAWTTTRVGDMWFEGDVLTKEVFVRDPMSDEPGVYRKVWFGDLDGTGVSRLELSDRDGRVLDADMRVADEVLP